MSGILALARKYLFGACLLPGLLLSCHCSATSAFKVLHSFTGESGDCFPTAGVVFDKAGNLYGTTYGGVCNNVAWGGTVYKMTPDGVESALYAFAYGASTGYSPTGNYDG